MENDKLETTSVPLIKENKGTQTESIRIEKENPNLKTGDSIDSYKTARHTIPFTGGFTKRYVKMNLDKVLANLIVILIEWKNSFGESHSILQIHKLQKILEENDQFFYSTNEARVLITLLKLILSNNNWLKTTRGQLSQLIEALESFKKGDLNSKKIDIFVQQVFRAQLGILSD